MTRTSVRGSRWLVIAVTFALATVAPAVTVAQPTPPSEAGEIQPDGPAEPGTTPGGSAQAATQAQYDALVLDALDAFDAREWQRARRLFERAHGLQPTARTLRTIGMCAFNQGDMVGALQHLEAALVDERKPLTPEQRDHARELIRRADDSVGRLRLLLNPAHAEVLVDGKSPALLDDGQLVLEPGRHELRIAAEGYASRTQHVRVAARDRATIEIALTAGPADGLAPAAPAPHPAAALSPTRVAREGSTGREAPEASPGRGWAWTTLSVGAAGAVVSGVATALAMSARSELDAQCPDRTCPAAAHDRVDDYNTLRSVAIVGAVVGAVGLTTGVVLWFAGGGEADERAPAVGAVIAPGWAGVRGRL